MFRTSLTARPFFVGKSTISGMTHVKTSPYYPQSNGKIERFHRTIKHDAVRKQTPLTKADADRVVGDFILHYNAVRLHSAIGYVAPHDVLAGRRHPRRTRPQTR